MNSFEALRIRNILPHIKAGDYLTILLGCITVVWLTVQLWGGGLADRAIIRSGGKIIQELSLSHNQTIEVRGPLGMSVITIEKHRARVSSDPSPRQYCVRQGWLEHAGETAICLPNQISLALVGKHKRYDSLNY